MHMNNICVFEFPFKFVWDFLFIINMIICEGLLFLDEHY